MPVKVFFSSVSSSLEIKKNQQKIFTVLDGRKIHYEAVDISQNSANKDLMRKLSGNPTALPPQIFNGNAYCGDVTAFDNAIEMNNLDKFFKL